MLNRALLMTLALLCLCSTTRAQDHLKRLETGKLEIQFAGPMAFGADGVLFVGDPMAASVYAIDTGDRKEGKFATDLQVSGLDGKIAAALGTKASEILINDMVVNPISGTPYISVSRGTGPDAAAVILKLASDGTISELELDNIPHAAAVLPNAPEADAVDRRGRSQRMISITDIALIDDQVVVAGLSNEEFSSNLRAIPYPFDRVPAGTALEVYHGAHGKYETNAPVRTFTSITLNNEPYLVAAYTCTPLVRFPLSEVTAGEKIRGTTVAELGNWNSPLDMFEYEKDGKSFILMANTARGMMKISVDGMESSVGITEPVENGGVKGQNYETIDELKTAVQLDRFGDGHAIVIVKNEDGTHDLRVVELP